MLALIIRCLLFAAAPITALFVSRDALNFGVIEMLVATILVVGLCLAATAWSMQKPPDGGKATRT